MDRISDSDSEDAGSIPAGATNKADPEATYSRNNLRGLLQGRFIVLKRSTKEICFRKQNNQRNQNRLI
jgi:hypothetical protein